MEWSRLLHGSQYKSADGTFRIAPKLFYQVVIFLAKTGDMFIPCFFVLLPGKTRQLYDKMFTLLLDTIGARGYKTNWAGSYFMVDFEYAIRASVQVV